MNQETLGKIIDEVNENIYKNDLSPEETQKRIDKYCDDKGKMDLYAVQAFTAQEARDYTTMFVNDLLLRLFDEGYLKIDN